jgi:hypothetical protein
MPLINQIKAYNTPLKKAKILQNPFAARVLKFFIYDAKSPVYHHPNLLKKRKRV